MEFSREFARQRKARREAIDRRATELYDKLNPDWAHTINVSKAECIKRVERSLRTR